MVFIKSNIAEGSFLSRGTHVWLEILDDKGHKTTFSGSKRGGMLHVLRDYKRDFDRDHHRGLLEILPPEGMSENDWTEAVTSAAVEIENEMHGNYAFNGIWPRGETRAGVARSNCCRVVVNIIERAGGKIPNGRIKGVLPGLGRGWRDYL
jgi:hypothetical protein